MGDLSTPSQLHSNYGRRGKFQIFDIAKIIYWGCIWANYLTQMYADQFWASIYPMGELSTPSHLNCILIIGEGEISNFWYNKNHILALHLAQIDDP